MSGTRLRGRAAWRHGGARMVARALLATTSLFAIVPQSAVAQSTAATTSTKRTYNIPGQSLDGALAAFSRVSGNQVLNKGATTQGITSPGVTGAFTAQQAVSRLLAGTGLTPKFVGANTVTVINPTAATSAPATIPGAIALDTINVQGASSGGTPPPYAGGQVATGARLGILGNRSILNTPFNVTSYTEKTIQDQQARSIAEVVKNDPSVRTTWADGNYDNQFTIRGFPSSQADMAINGLYGLAPSQMAATSWIDRVEVMKGPGALLTGMAPGGSIGGIINLVPKRATDDPITRLTASYISKGQFGLGVDLARRFGANKEYGVRFNGAFSDGNAAVDGQSNQLRNASLGLDYRGDRIRLSADLIYQKNDSDNPARPIYYRSGFQIPKAPSASADLGQNWYYAHSEDYIASLHAEYDVTDNITAYASFGAHRNKFMGLYNFEYIKNAAGDFDANNYYQPNYTNILTGEVGATAKFETGLVRHELNISASSLYSESGNRPQVISTYSSNIYAPGRISEPDLSRWFDTTPKTSATKLQSIAIADSLYFLDDRLQLILGGRYQNVEQQAWNVTSRVQTADYDKGAFTPAVGFVAKPWENVSLYANYIEGLSQGPVAPAGALNAGEAFAPLKSKQYEVGAKVDFGRLTATASLFQIEQPGGYLDGTTNIYGVNGETRNRGAELNAFGELTDSIRLLGGVAFMDGIQTKTLNGANNGKKAIGIPDVQLNLGAEWDTPFVQGLTVTGRMIYTSSQYASVDNTQSIPDWTRFDVGARYKFERANGKPITIRASVENVFGKSYWAAASSSYGLARGAPRTFLVSSAFDF